MATIDETKFRQDMPPQGGYAKIYFQRTFPKISPRIGKNIALAIVGLGICGFYKFRAWRAQYMRFMVEQNDARIVAKGFYLAERDRIWLNFLLRQRDKERDLMKNVPGWRVGTFYGEPIYYTLPADKWWDPAKEEVYAHSSYYNQRFNNHWRMDMELRGGPKWYDKYLPHWLENT